MPEIAGHVADATTGMAIAGVVVEAWDSKHPRHAVLARAETDEAGAFLLAFESSLRPRDVYLTVLRGGVALPSPDPARWDGGPKVVLRVTTPSDPLSAPAPAPALTIAELGEALAATAASIQQELAHYPTTSGTFLLEDLDVEIPAGFGVDALGQVRVRLGDGDPPESVGRLRLRVKPLLEPPGDRSVTASEPLESLGALTPELIARLEAERVYTVGDLLRVSRNPAGRRALEQLGVADVLAVRSRAEVVALPTVPRPVAEALVRLGITEPKGFVRADPAELATRLEQHLGEPFEAGEVATWQSRTRPFVEPARVR